jgi:hypothetical protein
MKKDLAASIVQHIDARIVRLRELGTSARGDERVDDLLVAVQDILHLVSNLVDATPEQTS